MLFTIQPVGVSYTTPVPLTYPNIDQLPAGAEVDLYQVDRDLGTFVISGQGRVSADGQRIETISGGVTATTWGCAHPQSTEPDPNGADPQDEDNPNPCCPSIDGGSLFSLNDGHMSTQFTLPAYRSLEASRALSFRYRSFRAYPRPVIETNNRASRANIFPPTLSYQLEIAGIRQGQETYLNGRVNSQAFRTAISFDGSDFQSSMYDYRLITSSNFNRSRSSNISTGRIMVVNEQRSPFGTGWMLAGLYHLAFNPQDNSIITLIAPSGNSLTYRTEANGNYQSPDNDYAVFTRNEDNSYTHTEKDGNKMHFNTQGQLLRHQDRNGNTTTYQYNATGRLTQITDPVGLNTTLTYNPNGHISTITDPAGRISRFNIDAQGNLIKITHPDSTFEAYEYDHRHLMTTAHADERGNRSSDRYDTFGKIIDGTLPDGTVISAVGKTNKGLIDLSSGLGTLDNPAPVPPMREVSGDYTDGRGNNTSKALDSHGRALMEIDEIGRVTMHERDIDSNPTQTTR